MIPYFLIAFFYRFPIQLLTKVDINGNLGKEFVGILVGINSGHLWFLFMLFFLFSAFYLLEDFFSKIGSLYSLITLSIVSIVSIYFSNYLQFHSILFYLVFFYFGYLLKSREEILSIKNNYLWFVFFFLLHLGVFTYSIFQTYSPLLAQFLSLILGFLGILFSYQFSKIVLSAIDLSKFKTFNFLDNNSMIIYLFHEPIIFIILSKVGTYTWHSTFTVLICFFGSFLISSMIAYFIPRSQFLANTLKV
jgi:hypothetical protein